MSGILKIPKPEEKPVNEKLTTGDSFPVMQLTATDGSDITVPEPLQPGAYQIVLFFRGKF